MDLETSIKLSDPNSYYGTPFRYWITKYLPKMIQSICPKSNADILDLGCGQGQYAELIKSLPINGSYIGIDLDRRENWNRIEPNQKLNIAMCRPYCQLKRERPHSTATMEYHSLNPERSAL